MLAYLLFEHGLQYEGHPQNVLFEISMDERLTGRLVLRDLSDASVNIAFRLAKRKKLPIFAPGFFPRRAPFPIVGNAADYRTNARRWCVLRGFDTVERYGLYGFVWAVNTSLTRLVRPYDSNLVRKRYSLESVANRRGH